jgi:septal ring factor EnvC (AmiA/AmiB activator)
VSGANTVSEEEDKLRVLQRQLSLLVRKTDEQRAEIKRLQEQLQQQTRERVEEREYLAAQLKRIARSGTWRWGHRLATLRWRVTRRPIRNSDAVTQLLERVATPQLLGPEDEGQIKQRGGETAGNGAGEMEGADQR